MNITPFTRFAGRLGLQLQKHAPTIMTIGGVVGGAVTVGLAIKATTRIEEILVPIEDVKTKHDTEDSDEYARDIRKAYIATGIKALKLYGPAISTGIASTGLILGAHGVMSKRNAALTAAYNTLETAYNAYKARVTEEIGKEKAEELEGTPMAFMELNEETGELEEVQGVVYDNPYLAQFDFSNANWVDGDIEENLRWLTLQQNYFNDRLVARGHVFLNEVRRSIGLEDTKAGAVTGWVLNNPEGDSYIDFELDHHRPAKPYENDHGAVVYPGESITLNFNVDGTILDKI